MPEAPARHRHDHLLLKRDSRCAMVRMKTPVDAPNHGNARGCGSPLRSRLRIRRCPALQRQQAGDHLQVVRESMIGLAAQERLILVCLVFLTKQACINSDDLLRASIWSISHLDGPPMSFRFGFIACCPVYESLPALPSGVCIKLTTAANRTGPMLC